MIYRMEAACLSIVIFISVVYFSAKKEHTSTHRLFSNFILCAIAQLVMDTVTVYTINHLDTVPAIINRMAHQLFVLFLLLLLYYVVLYIIAIMQEDINEIDMPVVSHRYIRMVQIGIILGIVFLPVGYKETPMGNYAYGPLVLMAYVGIILCILWLFKGFVKYRNEIANKKKRVIFFVLITEVIVTAYQAIVPHSLISGIGIVVIVLGLYLTVESPDAILIEHLKAETRRADAANDAKSTFLANVSHEIRTPINAVLGMDEMILRESRDSHIREYASNIKASAKSLLRIINDILDITKIETGKMEVIPVEYDFGSMICNVVNLTLPATKEKGLKLEISIDEDIPSRLIGDDVRIRQVLMNLLSNAIKYTMTGTIWLNIHMVEKDKNVQILFEVLDTGIGIKEEDIGRLYVAFERIEKGRNRQIEGTGLGLVITAQLLQMMGSSLSVRSVYGEGTSFFFQLSQEIGEDIPLGDFQKRLQANEENLAYEGTYEAPDAKILVVDDAIMNRKVFSGLLEETKIQVAEASSGEECLRMVQNEYFDLIFMDHKMPGMDGVETYNLMQKLEDYPCKNTPVIILTANAIRGAKQQYLEQGFDDFLTKPIEPEGLEEMIKKWLPEEMIHLREKSKNAMQQGEFIELPMIGGVDWSYARLHFKRDAEIKDAVQFFCSIAETEAEELEEYYRHIAREDMLEAYHVKVHSMKNAAGMIGILPLTGMAKILEDAANSQDIEKILICHEVFIGEWRAYKQKMLQCIEPDTEEKVTVPAEVITELLLMLKEAAEDMDIDRMDNIILQLNKYLYEPEEEAKIQKIAEAVTRFDLDKIVELVDDF